MSKKILKYKRAIDKNKEIKKIINIFKRDYGTKAFRKYVLVHGKGTLMHYKNGEIISSILEKKWSEEKYVICIRLAATIFHELGGRHYEEGTHFYVPKIYKEFQEFMYEDSVFGSHQVPWEEWEDIAKDKLDMLKVFMDDNVFGEYKKYKNYKCFRDYCKKFDKRCDDLEDKGYILYNGA